MGYRISLPIRCGIVLVCFASIACAAKPKKDSEKNQALVSLVLLIRKPYTPSKEVFAKSLTRAFGNRARQVDLPAPEGVTVFPVLVGEARLGLFACEKPYFEDTGAAADRAPDAVTRDAILQHRAWISVDWFGDLPPERRPEAYKLIGKLLAEFADDDNTLAVFAPEKGQILSFKPVLREKLRGPSPVDVFVDDVTINVEGDNLEMERAVKKAREHWPEFVAAYNAKKSDIFAAKAPFREGNETEYMWLRVTKITEDTVTGILDNEPNALTNLKVGQELSFKLSDLNDWVYKDRNGSLVGGYTIKVLTRRQNPETRPTR